MVGLSYLQHTFNLSDEAVVQRWIDGRFSHVLPSGLFAYWVGHKDVRVEVALTGCVDTCAPFVGLELGPCTDLVSGGVLEVA